MRENEHLFDGEIQWPIVQKFIKALALQEENIIIKEYYARNRYQVDASTEEKRQQNLPMLQREKEHFICPTKKGWQERYYDSFFSVDKTNICKEYGGHISLEHAVLYYRMYALASLLFIHVSSSSRRFGKLYTINTYDRSMRREIQ